MIPLTIADEVQATLLDYLATTFNLQDGRLETALLEFLTQSPGGMFQGPYIQLRLPFQKAANVASPPADQLEIMPPFKPYLHQSRAFARLTSNDDHAPQPTLITTDTGSGKTEAFLYPILDHCYRQREAPGIKAIILYPMNALATDQAGRLAAAIWQNERLRGQVSAGLYIGGESQSPHTQMGASHLSDDRATLRKSPPDILLTNYRMLDFLLLRPEDKDLWAHNEPDTLRYLVLDELHTYDGAQGSDVACLIRRLQARLRTPPGVLCPIGTSATVAAGQDVAEAASDKPYHSLTAFAAQIFNTPFPADAVISEKRRSLSKFLPDAATLFHIPTAAAQLAVQPGEAPETYRARQMRLWLNVDTLDPIALGEALKTHSFLRALLTELGDNILPLETLCRRLARAEPDFAAQPAETQAHIVQSFLALVAHARRKEDGRTEPFLTLQAQLWVREMSRLMRVVDAAPGFFWRDDVSPHAETRGLPAYVCRECGHSGWLTLRHDGDTHVSDETDRIYRTFFERHKNTTYLYPGRNSAVLPGMQDHLCPRCLGLTTKEECDVCGAETIPVVVHRALSQPKGKGPRRDRQQCPICGTEGSLGIMGRQAASLLSVAISFLYNSRLNEEKKLLAFTDSVQDASHRAAFFGARTYRFNVRTAFQTVLEANSARGAAAERAHGVPALPLTAFADQVLAFWQDRWQQEMPAGEAAGATQQLAATFMPPDLHEMPDYRQFIDGPPGPLSRGLRRALRQRLSWEVTMEYGFNARIGRSLEKVGSSTAFLDLDRMETAVETLTLMLGNEIGLLRGVQADTVQQFVLGLLERTRLRGGVVHSLLQRYVEDQGNWYLLTKKMQPLLSPFAKRSPRFPRFLTDTPVRDVFDQILSRNPGTWPVDWARRTLSADLGQEDINEIYRLLLPNLVAAGLLQDFPRGQATAYGIRPEALWVTNETSAVRCDTCGQRQTVTPVTGAQWVGMACLNFRCDGHYQTQQDGESGANSYYRGIYERGQVHRIFSEEHTGLLARDVREKIESGFRSQQRADEPNLLTATPTLEMGIDIGDLSATMACSVPPATANYLQRIGRAGRKTGNAFILTLANVQPHDLYYFEEPLQMIAGEIVPPGCFLDAPNMLQRQFLAFTMDSWTATDPQAKQLPRNVKEMLARVSRDGFPTDMLRFFAHNRTALIDAFLNLFVTEVSAANRTLLRDYAHGEALPRAVMAAVEQAAETRQQLRNQYRALRTEEKRIEENQAQYDEPEEELAQIDREMKLVLAQVKELEEKYILSFFTDAGLLPNYAFPETGVYLNAIITGIETAKKEEKRYRAYEYLRPAPLAIRELAPFNTFYAQGHKVMVNSVDVRGKDVVIEPWQYCDQCAYMAPVSSSHYTSSCPRCGSELWHDMGQQHDMLRLRNVAARTDYQQSISRDDSEEREREYYQTGTYFEVDRDQSQGAYLLPGLPFGVEHLNEVVLREINFGLSESWGQKVTIAGEERPEEGFFVCPGCGVVFDPRQNEETTPTQHARTCPAAKRARRTKGDTGPLSASSIDWHNLYLYRTMTSEALRLLLPVSTVFVGEKLATFQACLDLGMRLWFRGNPIHLNIAPMDELSPDGTRRRFLIIYDAVPGGTSYLRDLAEPDAFRDLLLLTLDHLTSCDCRQDKNKPACYRCLYSYRTQYQKELISRQRGVDLLQEILAEWPELTPIASLSDADLVSLIESELEQRFIDALAAYADRAVDAHWRTRLQQGRTVWQLTLADRDWLVQPQVPLGPEDGVAVHCRPDFILWPVAAARGVLPVAVFTDGFAYHALPQHPRGRVGDDLHKREAIRASGKFLVWSLTWDDVVSFADDDAFTLTLMETGQMLKFGEFLRKQGSPFSTQLLQENGVHQLLRYLRHPDLAPWETVSSMLALVHLFPPRPGAPPEVTGNLTRALRTAEAMPPLTIPQNAATGSQLYGIRERNAVSLLAHAPVQAIKSANFEAFAVTLRLDDTFEQRNTESFKEAWHTFLLLANLLQFLPNFVPVTTEGIQQFGTAAVAPEQDGPDTGQEAWSVVFEYALPECTTLLHQCRDAGIRPPTVGYELSGADGSVIGMAELAWEAAETAVFLEDQDEDEAAFQQAGWQLFKLDDTDHLLAHLRAAA